MDSFYKVRPNRGAVLACAHAAAVMTLAFHGRQGGGLVGLRRPGCRALPAYPPPPRACERALRDALTDLDAIALRREVRTLRVDLRASLTREADLQKELEKARARTAADAEAMERREAAERKLRDDMDYVRSVAVDAQRARAAYAMGGLAEFLPPSCS